MLDALAEVVLFFGGYAVGTWWFTVQVLPLFYGFRKAAYWSFRGLFSWRLPGAYLVTFIGWFLIFVFATLALTAWFPNWTAALSRSPGFGLGQLIGAGWLLIRAFSRKGKQDLREDFLGRAKRHLKADAPLVLAEFYVRNQLAASAGTVPPDQTEGPPSTTESNPDTEDKAKVFCCRCGRSVRQGWSRCPSCGADQPNLDYVVKQVPTGSAALVPNKSLVEAMRLGREMRAFVESTETLEDPMAIASEERFEADLRHIAGYLLRGCSDVSEYKAQIVAAAVRSFDPMIYGDLEFNDFVKTIPCDEIPERPLQAPATVEQLEGVDPALADEARQLFLRFATLIVNADGTITPKEQAALRDFEAVLFGPDVEEEPNATLNYWWESPEPDSPDEQEPLDAGEIREGDHTGDREDNSELEGPEALEDRKSVV